MSRVAAIALPLAAIGLLLAGCGVISTTPPAPTASGFQGIATELTKRGVVLDQLVSGDAGCDDRALIPTAISLQAKGLDQTQPVKIYLYIFADHAAFERLLPAVDDCARTYVTDPSTYKTVERSPFMAAGQGPWAPGFEAAVRDALVIAAGTGG